MKTAIQVLEELRDKINARADGPAPAAYTGGLRWCALRVGEALEEARKAETPPAEIFEPVYLTPEAAALLRAEPPAPESSRLDQLEAEVVELHRAINKLRGLPSNEN